MPDREKVIKGLEACLAAEVTEDENPCASCPYFFDEMCQSAIKKDALALLREQEPVKPNDDEECGECGYLLHRINYEGPYKGLRHEWFRFCPRCGKKVKWDDAE